MIREQWENEAMQMPQHFDVTARMSRQDGDLLRKAQAKYDVMFKVCFAFHMMH